MTVKEIFLNGEYLYVSGDGYQTQGDFFLHREKVEPSLPNLETMLSYGMLCNNASIVVKKGKNYIDGDPTDGALLVAAKKFGLTDELGKKFRIIKEFPFDSDRKRMSVVLEDENQMRFLITKGAPDVLLPRSAFYMDKDSRKLLNKENKALIEGAINEMANKALRTIAIGMRNISNNVSLDSALLEDELTLIGLYGLMDPPRKEVKSAIRECKEAGIKTVMITGDHVNTARAIAENLQLLPTDGLVVEGHQHHVASRKAQFATQSRLAM